MMHAPLAAAAFIVAMSLASANETVGPITDLSAPQKDSAMQPLVRSATECIARSVAADPRFVPAQANLGDLIVDAIPSCTLPVRAMIDACDRYYGACTGEAFFKGAYLDILPRAVSEWVRALSH